MKVTFIIFSLFIFASFSLKASADSKKKFHKSKVVVVTFDEADVKKSSERAPASLIEKQEIDAQARSEVRVNRDDWSGLEF